MTLKGGETTGWLEISGPEVMRFLVFFFFASCIPNLELKKLATQKRQ